MRLVTFAYSHSSMKHVKKCILDLNSRWKSCFKLRRGFFDHRKRPFTLTPLKLSRRSKCLKAKNVFLKKVKYPLNTLHSSYVLFYTFHTVK